MAKDRRAKEKKKETWKALQLTRHEYPECRARENKPLDKGRGSVQGFDWRSNVLAKEL